MTLDEILEKLAPWGAAQERPAWVPATNGEKAAESNSWFGGAPLVSDSDQWPTCNDCDEPMRFMFQLAGVDLPSEFKLLDDDKILQVFYCSSDDGNCECWEPFSGTHRIRCFTEQVAAPEHPTQFAPLTKKVITGWRQIVDLPHPEEHEELGLSYKYDWNSRTISLKCNNPPLEVDGLRIKDDIPERIAIPEQGDKLGGWPAWVQGPEYPSCPECGTRLRALFQVDSEDNLDYMFGDCGCAHLTQCPNHTDVFAFGWACC